MESQKCLIKIDLVLNMAKKEPAQITNFGIFYKSNKISQQFSLLNLTA